MTQTQNKPVQPDQHQQKDDGRLEQLARHIDPPGRETSDQELKDPGRAIPGSRQVDNRS